MRQELVATTAPEKLRDVSDERGKSTAAATAADRGAARGGHGARRQRSSAARRRLGVRCDVRGEKEGCGLPRRPHIHRRGRAASEERTPRAAAAIPAPGSGHSESPRLQGQPPPLAPQRSGTWVGRMRPPFRPLSRPGGCCRVPPGVRGGQRPAPLPAGTQRGSEGRPRGAPPPPARSPRGGAAPGSWAGPGAGRGERSRAPPQGLARPRHHPPPRYRGEPGPPPPHLAAWAAAPGPAAGAGQRAAQSMGRVPGGAGGRPRRRREAAGTGQTLKRMSGASSGRGGSDGTATGGGGGGQPIGSARSP